MELRVWVDGTQRVVCGVKLTTTCQEIVFALAHATQQAGRFTMIEKWGNIERLLSPNEQPLVTLQRWGGRMNEVEFILRKTSTDLQPVQQLQQNPPQTQQPPPPSQIQQPQRPPVNHVSGLDESNNQTLNHINGRAHESPINSFPSPTSHQQQSYDSVYQQRQYNLTRRPQTSLGTGSQSNFMPSPQQLTRLTQNNFRTAMSASALPTTVNMTASPSNSSSFMRNHYSDDQIINNNSIPMRNIHANGYQKHNDNTVETNFPNLSQTRIETTATTNNLPFEDMYSIQKKPTNLHHPPAVPAKPRVNQLAPVPNMNSSQLPPIAPLNNAQINYYLHNHSPMFSAKTVRPRQPPGYLDYMEAMTRNSLPQPMSTSTNFASGNMINQSHEPNIVYQGNAASPMNNKYYINDRYRYSINGQINSTNYEPEHNLTPTIESETINSIRTMNLDNSPYTRKDNGSVINHKFLNFDESRSTPLETINRDASAETSLKSNNNDAITSVSKIGHDMLKVIEEQKRLLMNQKNELDKLDHDTEYWQSKQNIEQIELINRIESEIHQLEDLWKENQAQIKKLENQNLEKELENLKLDQQKLETEVIKQKNRLSKCESDLDLCKNKMDQLEKEVGAQISPKNRKIIKEVFDLAVPVE